jgi:hypothetical protein
MKPFAFTFASVVFFGLNMQRFIALAPGWLRGHKHLMNIGWLHLPKKNITIL